MVLNGTDGFWCGGNEVPRVFSYESGEAAEGGFGEVREAVGLCYQGAVSFLPLYFHVTNSSTHTLAKRKRNE